MKVKKIVWVMEGVGPPVAAVHPVVTKAGTTGLGGMWHAGISSSGSSRAESSQVFDLS